MQTYDALHGVMVDIPLGITIPDRRLLPKDTEKVFDKNGCGFYHVKEYTRRSKLERAVVELSNLNILNKDTSLDDYESFVSRLASYIKSADIVFVDCGRRGHKSEAIAKKFFSGDLTIDLYNQDHTNFRVSKEYRKIHSGWCSRMLRQCEEHLFVSIKRIDEKHPNGFLSDEDSWWIHLRNLYYFGIRSNLAESIKNLTRNHELSKIRIGRNKDIEIIDTDDAWCPVGKLADDTISMKTDLLEVIAKLLGEGKIAALDMGGVTKYEDNKIWYRHSSFNHAMELNSQVIRGIKMYLEANSKPKDFCVRRAIEGDRFYILFIPV